MNKKSYNLETIHKAVKEYRFDEALKLLKSNLFSDPDHRDSLYLAAVCTRYLKRYEDSKNYLKKLLINVVDGENGTGRSLKLENYIIGGKTGTSRTHIEGVGYSDYRYNTSFTGFIETSKGPVVGSVILWGASVNPRSEYVTGGSTAAPIFKNIVSNLVPGE